MGSSDELFCVQLSVLVLSFAEGCRSFEKIISDDRVSFKKKIDAANNFELMFCESSNMFRSMLNEKKGAMADAK